ncbi:MAG TPA: glycosyltransferase family 4 protein [Gaiellaceae bacterium]|nr:glycosyltransferase family 4 protein [Gaiellaceae bacterium]
MSEPRPLVVGMGWFPDRPGGLNRYVRGLVEALPEARAVVLGPAADAPGRVRAVSRVDAPLPLRLLALRRAARAAARDADLLDAHFALTALLLPRRLPLVVHFHGPWADEAAFERAPRLVVAAKRAAELRLYRRARRLVTLTEAFAELLASRYGIERERIAVVPPGVELDRFAPGDRAAARERLGLPAAAFVAVAARRLVPRMGLDVLLDAWPEVERARPGAVLALAGAGPERERLEARAPGSVRFLGRVEEALLPDLYRAADVCVVPSLALEGFGLTVVEALASGTPAVVSDAGGLPEAVAGLEPSLVVPAGDAAALAERLLAQLPSSAACRAHAERFAWERAAELTRAVYRAALRPRVVFVDHTAVLSGGELALLLLLPELDVDAHVVLAEEGPLAERLRERGLPVEILPLPERTRALRRDRTAVEAPLHALRTLGYSVRLARRLRALDADVVHTNSLKAALYGGLAARLARVPAVWHVRDRIAPDYLPRATVLLVRTAARVLPSAIVANSAATLATLPRRRRAAVVPSPVAAVAAYARGGGFRVGILGRIAPWKGQHVFLDAFAQAFPGGDETARVIGAPLFGAGEERYERELRALAASLGCDGRVEFRGFRDDVAAELSELDVLVHASTLPEPFGQVVVQGMAAGLPVVAAGAGGPAELIEHGVDGLLYPPGDADALAALLRDLRDDPELRGRLGAAARERAAEFRPARIASRLAEVYDSLR